MGEKDKVKYCLNEARSLASGEHYGAALVFLVQATELAAKKFLQLKRGIRVPYFSACIPYLREAGVIKEEESALRRINTRRNLVIHSGLPISKQEYEEARAHLLKLIEKLSSV